jgi:hypothetical protein
VHEVHPVLVLLLLLLPLLMLQPVLDVVLITATASGYIGGALLRLMHIRREIPED